MVYYNPYITGWYNPLYNPTNQGFFPGSKCQLGTVDQSQFPGWKLEPKKSKSSHPQKKTTNMTGWKIHH